MRLETYDPTSDDLTGLEAGDTAWILTSSILVLLYALAIVCHSHWDSMTPALAFFYGGLVARKNIINTLLLSFTCVGIVMVQWVLFGYSLAFEPNNEGIGSLGWSALTGWGLGPTPDAETIPGFAHVIFQAAFAIVTPALISGAIVGRIKLSAYMLFIFFWSTFVYDVLAHWMWSRTGWIKVQGAIDFAGGTVVHISSGVSACVAGMFLGHKADKPDSEGTEGADTAHKQDINEANSIPFTVLGGGLLWIGWNGFNGGSALAANGQAGSALAATNLGAAGGMLAWLLLDAVAKGFRTPSVSGGVIGAVVGLVGVTPACGYVHPGWGALIGVLAAAGTFFSTALSRRWRWMSDELDVFTCHGIGGAIGTVLTGLFADSRFGGVNGMFYGNPRLLGLQVMSVVVTVAYAAAISAVILWILKVTIGIRVSAWKEKMGLDEALHKQAWKPLMKPTAMRRGSVDLQRSMTSVEASYHNKMLALAQQQHWGTSLPAAQVCVPMADDAPQKK